MIALLQRYRLLNSKIRNSFECFYSSFETTQRIFCFFDRAAQTSRKILKVAIEQLAQTNDCFYVGNTFVFGDAFGKTCVGTIVVERR